MATVFFKISDIQESEVKTLMEEEGYTSKAEFFRFLIKFYKYKKSPDQIRFEKAADELGEVLVKLKEEGRLDTRSIEEQLSNVRVNNNKTFRKTNKTPRKKG